MKEKKKSEEVDDVVKIQAAEQTSAAAVTESKQSAGAIPRNSFLAFSVTSGLTRSFRALSSTILIRAGGDVDVQEGPRSCIGRNFALHDLMIFTAIFFRSFEVHSDDTANDRNEALEGITFRPLKFKATLQVRSHVAAAH